jgi:protein-tyrosine-phosphatase
MDFHQRARIHAALGDPGRLAIVDALVLGDRTPGELAASCGMASNLAAHHLGVLETAGVVERRRSEGDGRRRYVVLDRRLVGGLVTPAPVLARRVLFVCTHNSARSVFAAALWEKTTGVAARSAGSHPAERVHPTAVAVGAEHGLELGGVHPTGLAEVDARYDLVVSVCDRAGESTIPVAGARLHWSIPDPVGAADRSAFDRAFAEIELRVTTVAAAAGAAG